MTSIENSTQQTTSSIPSRPFFDLPYDIRGMIYEDFDDLPPASNGRSYNGFILACMEAKSVVEHVATVRAKKHLQDFKALLLAKTGVVADISTSLSAIDTCFSQLRQVDITVPFDKIFNARGIPGEAPDDVTPGLLLGS
jgi:hypothetical protein